MVQQLFCIVCNSQTIKLEYPHWISNLFNLQNAKSNVYVFKDCRFQEFAK